MLHLGARLTEWVETATGSAIVETTQLCRATSAAVTAVTTRGGDRFVVRAYHPSYLASEPVAPSREASILQLLRGTSVPAPNLVAADPAGAEAGRPALLLTFIPGVAGIHPQPWPQAAAGTLADIHALETISIPYRFFRYARHTTPKIPAWAEDRALWERAFTAATASVVDRPRLIHRDFHHGNTLWDGVRAAVVDWSSASVGPHAFDLAHFRLNLTIAGRGDLEAAFLAEYRGLTGRDLDPRWDIVAAIDSLPWDEGLDDWHGLPGSVGPDPRRDLERFLARALAALG